MNSPDRMSAAFDGALFVLALAYIVYILVRKKTIPTSFLSVFTRNQNPIGYALTLLFCVVAVVISALAFISDMGLR